MGAPMRFVALGIREKFNFTVSASLALVSLFHWSSLIIIIRMCEPHWTSITLFSDIGGLDSKEVW